MSKAEVDPRGWPDYTYPMTIIGQELNVAIDIAAQTIPTLDINIAAATAAINIKTSSGANIVIDKLTQTAHNARQEVFIQNHGDTPSMVSLAAWHGKLFARGMRGHPMAIYIYCDNIDTVDHTITVKASPYIGMGAIWTGTITVPAGASPDWRLTAMRVPWQYDSMFVWFKPDSDKVRIGQDSATYDVADGFTSPDEKSWVEEEYRWWVKIYQAGESIGDLPVAGTVSSVIIPVLSSAHSGGTVAVPADGTATALEVEGSGTIENLLLYSDYNNMYVRIYCDDSLQLIDPLLVPHSTLQFNNWQAVVADVGVGGNVILSKYDTVNNRYVFQLNIKFQFKRSFKVVYYNPDTANHNAVATAIVNLIR